MQWCAELSRLQQQFLLGKRQSYGIVSVFLLAAFVLSGQTWFNLSMSPAEQATLLLSFDGFTTYGFVLPSLLVMLAAFAVVTILSGISRFLILLVASFFSVALSVLWFINVPAQNLSAVATQLESATGIAANHSNSSDFPSLLIQTTPTATAAFVIYALLAVTFILSAISSLYGVAKTKTKGVGKPQRKSDSRADPITAWDNQR